MLTVVFILYIVAVLGIGAVAARYTKGVEGYYLADRKQGSWVTAISSAASSESGWVTLGLVGMGYSQGYSASWFVVGCLGGFVINWYLVAPRLRRLSSRFSSVTIPDLLEDRTRPSGPGVRLVAVAIIFLCMMGYVAAQLTAAGKTFQVVLEHDYRLGVIVGTIITILYTLAGGYRAVSWTDLAQGLLMVCGLVGLPLYLMGGFIGGPAELDRRLAEVPARTVLQVEARRGAPLWSEKVVAYVEEDRLAIRAPEEDEEIRGGIEMEDLLLAGLDRGERAALRWEPSDEVPAIHIVRQGAIEVVVEGEPVSSDTREVTLRKGERGGEDGWPSVTIEGWSLSFAEHSTSDGAVLTSPWGRTDPWKTPASILAVLGMIAGALGIGLGYPGQPHVLTRYMAARSDRRIRLGRVIAIGWGVLSLYGAIILGHAARLYLPELADPEFAYPAAAKAAFHPVLAGVLLAAIVCAIMSTADSQLLVAASAAARDVYEKLVDPDAPERTVVLISRATVCVLGLLSLVFALSEARVVFWFVLFAWSGLGASFGPAILLGLFWRRLTAAGTIAGMVTGFGTTVVWKIYREGILKDWLGFDLYELVPAFALSLLATVVVSLLTTPPAEAEADLTAIGSPDDRDDLG